MLSPEPLYESEKYLKVNLLNHQTIYPPIRIDEVAVEIKLDDDKKVKSVSDITGGKLEWSLSGGILKLVTDLDIYKLIVVEVE